MRAERISDLTVSEDSGKPLLQGAGREGMLLFVLLALLVLGVIWGAAWSVIALEHGAAEENTVHASSQLLEAYKAQMVRNLGAIDQTLKVVKFAYEFQENRFSLPELSEKGLLPSSVVFDVRVADAEGNPIDSSSTRETGADANISARDYFLAHRQFDTGKPYVGDSTYDGATHQWELHFSRRLNTAEGAFGGAVVITVDPAYFTSGYEHASLGEHGTIGLLGPKGQILILRSGDTTRSGGRPVDIAAFGDDAATAKLQYDTWDGVDRYTAIERIPGSQLFAVVGLAEEEQFAEFRRHRRNYLLEAGATSILLILVAGVLSRLMSQLNASRRHMRQIQQTYHAASEGSVDAFYVLQNVLDAGGAIVDFRIGDVNQQGEKLVGMQKSQMVGRTLTELFPNVHANHFLADLIGVAKTGALHEKEWHNDGDSALRAEWLYRQVVQVEDGVVTIMRDISERKRLETKVQYQATHDALTGLANRTLLHDRLNQAIAQATRNEREIWVIFVDLDRFKMVNDSLGHKAGDTFLLAVAERLQAIVREADTVARLGGDEFVLVLPEAGDNKISANTLGRIMQTISRPILVEEKEFSLNCSLGVAVFPNDGEAADLLIERADMAMYRAKETGRNNFQFFTAEMNERLIERMRIEEALREAVDRQEFELHYQPQVDLASGRVIGAEALIRWRHPEMGLISPARFIPLAEETGLIVPIGYWVLRTACDQITAWDHAGLSGLRIAVNLSARQFAQPDLVQSIADALQDSGIAPGRLEIELTEGLVMTDVENAIETLHELKKLGLQLSIDDFGTGYSSLSYLQRFPIDVLKIDQSFVRDITGSSGDATIVHTIISMAHNLGLRVIAEGVETEAQLSYLQKHECDEMQGYYFSRPLPVKEMEVLLREGKRLEVVQHS